MIARILRGVSIVQRLCIVCVSAMAVAVSTAQTIDFESVPGLAAPVDRMGISNQFQATYGVTFSFEGGGFPYLAQVGPPRTAFIGAGGPDSMQENQGVGQFFLTDNKVINTLGPPPPPLVITYSVAVAAASGSIIDIDSCPSCGGEEDWRIEARDATNGVLATHHLTPASFNAGNGRATSWSFRRDAADIQNIRIVFVGPKTNGVGLAFDNFSPALPVAPARVGLTVTQGVAALAIEGTIGATYRVEHSATLAPESWLVLTNLLLPETPHVLSDSGSTNATRRFYRAVGL